MLAGRRPICPGLRGGESLWLLLLVQPAAQGRCSLLKWGSGEGICRVQMFPWDMLDGEVMSI